MNPANRLSARICLTFILILPLVLFWRWLLRGEVLFWGTTMLQFWPWHHLTKLSLLAGEWPLWNPLLGNGAPLLANLQSAVFYPPNLLYLLLPIEHGLTVSVILHLALAGLLMYLYTRYLGLLPFAAALSALTYMFSGYIVGRTQFVVMVNAAAWLPLLLLLSDRLARQRNPLDILGLGLVLAVQLLAGHAQLWFYSLWLIGPYIIFRSWPARRRGGEAGEQGSRGAEEISRTTHHAPRLTLHTSHLTPHAYPLLALFAAILLAVLLSAAQLLPTAEFTTQSPRSSGAERTFALTYSFWPWRLLTLLAPTFFGHPANNDYWGYANYWEDHAYLGVLPFLLAWVALWNYGMRQVWGSEPASADGPQPGQFWRVVPFFATLVPLSLILAMGWNTPIYLWVFQWLPGFGFFQAPARLLIWYTVAVSVLAGVGVQSFKLTPAGRRGWQRLLVAAAGLTIAGLAGSFILTGRSQTFLAATMTLGLWLIISATLLLLRPRKTGRVASTHLTKEPLWQGAILIMVALDLLAAAWPLIPTLPAAVFQQPIVTAELLKTQPGGYRFFVDDTFDYDTKFKQYFHFSSFGPADPLYWQSLKETLIPNLGVYANLPAANNYDPLVVERWQHLVNLLEETNDAQRARLLALMNVGYFIGDTSHRVGPTLVASGTMTLQKVPQPLSRAYFVARAAYVPDEAAAIARLTAPDFDYHREVIIMEDEAEAKKLSEKWLRQECKPWFAGQGKPCTPAFQIASKSEAENGEVAVVEQGADRVALVVEAPASGFVVLTDSYYRGWQATVDGRGAPILPANLAFRAVAVEPGTHEVVFSYRPRSFTIGLWVSSLILAGMAITGILLIYKEV